jgi:hypothetical protein
MMPPVSTDGLSSQLRHLLKRDDQRMVVDVLLLCSRVVVRARPEIVGIGHAASGIAVAPGHEP